METRYDGKLSLNLYKDPDKQVKFLVHLMLTFRLLPESVSELFGIPLEEVNKMIFYKNTSTLGLDYLINHEALDQSIPKQQVVSFYSELVNALKNKDNIKVNIMLNELYDKKPLEIARNRKSREDITEEIIEATLKYQLKYGISQEAILSIFNLSRRGYQPKVSEYLSRHPEMQKRYEYLADYMLTYDRGRK